MTQTITNCTPHDIVLRGVDGDTVFPPSGIIPRMSVTTEEIPGLGFPCVMSLYGHIEGLPEMRKDTLLIVSSMVGQNSYRDDLIAPDTGPTAIRVNGQVAAVIRFQKFN